MFDAYVFHAAQGVHLPMASSHVAPTEYFLLLGLQMRVLPQTCVYFSYPIQQAEAFCLNLGNAAFLHGTSPVIAE